MDAKLLPGLLITGTDTNVGKTYVAARIVAALVNAGHRVGVYKPVSSGVAETADAGESEASDPALLWHAAGRPGDLGKRQSADLSSTTATPLVFRVSK